MAIAHRSVLLPGLAGIALALLAAAGCASTASTPTPTASASAAWGRCVLPPQLRHLGMNVTYLAAGRTIHTSGEDCHVRGGQFHAEAGGPAGAMAGDEVAIVVGGDAAAPACAKRGAIAGLQSGTLTVRRGPSTRYAKVDALGNGRRVNFCDWSADETWVGVVYPADAGGRCGVESPQADAAPYAGRCRAGWINARWVRVDAD
jgi:hypothetical protein